MPCACRTQLHLLPRCCGQPLLPCTPRTASCSGGLFSTNHRCFSSIQCFLPHQLLKNEFIWFIHSIIQTQLLRGVPGACPKGVSRVYSIITRNVCTIQYIYYCQVTRKITHTFIGQIRKSFLSMTEKAQTTRRATRLCMERKIGEKNFTKAPFVFVGACLGADNTYTHGGMRVTV